MGEYVPRLAGFGGFFREHSQIGGGVAIRTWGMYLRFSLREAVTSPREVRHQRRFRRNQSRFNIYRRID